MILYTEDDYEFYDRFTERDDADAEREERRIESVFERDEW